MEGTLMGLFVLLKDARVIAETCMARRCKRSGFDVGNGGRLEALRCTAVSNEGCGFVADGEDAVLLATDCRSEGNEALGFSAQGGALVKADGCVGTEWL
jgi:hypothetical protein